MTKTEKEKSEFDEWFDRVKQLPTTTRGELEEWKCPTPGCNCASKGRMLAPTCHPETCIVGCYVKDSAKIVLCCGECGVPFIALRIATDA